MNYAKINPDNVHDDIEQVTGVALQLAKHIVKHSLTGGAHYSKSEYEQRELYEGKRYFYDANRSLWDIYLQDKIHLSDKFDLTPGLVYTHYGNNWSAHDYNKTSASGDSRRLTFSLYGSYDFDKESDAYFSFAQIFRSVSGEYRLHQFADDILQDETG